MEELESKQLVLVLIKRIKQFGIKVEDLLCSFVNFRKQFFEKKSAIKTKHFYRHCNFCLYVDEKRFNEDATADGIPPIFKTTDRVHQH